MASDWRKCKMLSKGDVQSVLSVEKVLDSVFHVSDEATRHMVGLVKMLAARVVELESKGGKRAN